MDQYSAALDRAHRHALDWLSSLERRPVPPQASIDHVMQALGPAPLNDGSDAAEVVDLLAEACNPGLTAMGSGHFFGFVIGGTHPAALAADWLVSAWTRTAAAALVTGASSGIGARAARRLAEHGASVALVARRRDRLENLGAEIENAGGTALVVEADITERPQAEAAVQQAMDRFGRLDILVNNAGLMLLGPVVGADPEEWERMIAVNVKGLLHTTHAALPHLLHAAEQGPRQVADIVNISSIAGRVAWNGYGVYNLTKFGVNGFTESLRQEVTQRHLRVGVLEPGGVATELGSHNNPEVRNEMIDPFYEQTEVLAPEDIADGVAYMVTRPRHTAIGELWIMPTDQV